MNFYQRWLNGSTRPDRLLFIALLLLPFPLFVLFALKGAGDRGVDMIGYLRIAEYYAAGNYDLAVSGYWGPLLSWLMTPFLLAGMESFDAARVVMAASAALFLFAALLFLRLFPLTRPQFVFSGLIVALFALHRSIDLIAPDLLMAGIFLVAFALTITPARRSLLGWFGIGCLFGLAYLAKSVALPLSFAVVFAYFLFRIHLGALPLMSASRIAGAIMAGIMAVAAPWIVVLSLHYGEPTFSTSGAIAHTLVGPDPVNTVHPTFRSYHVPEVGRITTWEEPSRMAYTHWSPFADASSFRHQVGVISRNIRQNIRAMGDFDLLGLGVVLTLCGILFCSPWRERFREETWRSAPLAIGVLLAAYASVFTGPVRYFYICYPIMLGCAFAFLNDVIGNQADAAPEVRKRVRVQSALAIALVSGSFLVDVLPGTLWMLRNGNVSEEFSNAEALSALLVRENAGAVASVGDTRTAGIAVVAAYLSGRPYHGNRLDGPAADDVAASGATYIVVAAGSAEDRTLAADERFHALPPLDGATAPRLYRAGGT